jgi:Tfp pilus assembly protein PilO
MTPKYNAKYFFPLVAAVAIALLVIGWLLYTSRTNRLHEISKDLTKQRAELSRIQEEIRKQDSIAREHSRLAQELSMLEPGVPPYAYIPTFLRQIEHVAVATHNTIRGIRPIPQRKVTTPPAGGGEGGEGGGGGGEQAAASTPSGGNKAKAAEKPKLPYDSVGIEVKLQGTYWSVVNFLEQLRRFPKLIAVNDMDVRPVASSLQAYASPQLSVEMQMMAVVMKGDAQWASAKKN